MQRAASSAAKSSSSTMIDQSNPALVPGIYAKRLDRRQNRPRDRELWHQYDAAGDAGDHSL